MTEKLHPFDPDWVVPTAEVLREFMETMGLKTTTLLAAGYFQRGEQRDLAVGYLDNVLADKPFTDRTAAVLAKVTGTTIGFWIGFEQNYRAGLAAGKTVMGQGEIADGDDVGGFDDER